MRVWIWYAHARLGADPIPLPRALALLRNGGFGARVQAAQALVRIAVPATQGRIRHALEAAAIRDEFLNRALDDLNTRFPDDETK
ncbi:MAG: hypothetical protein H7Z41_16640 [Cytophagales bacterium]|nr:hypothetical protein [Armatimonadota bacterium]